MQSVYIIIGETVGKMGWNEAGVVLRKYMRTHCTFPQIFCKYNKPAQKSILLFKK